MHLGLLYFNSFRVILKKVSKLRSIIVSNTFGCGRELKYESICPEDFNTVDNLLDEFQNVPFSCGLTGRALAPVVTMSCFSSRGLLRRLKGAQAHKTRSTAC